MARPEQVITVVVIAVIALVGVATIGPIAGVVTDSTGITVEYLEPAPSEPTTVSGLSEETAVVATTENALWLNGSGSYVDDPADPAVFTNGAWTVGLVVEPGAVVDSEETRTLYAKNNETVHLLYEEGEWALRAKNDTGATAYANASASLDSRTTLTAAYNTTTEEVVLFVNGTQADTAAFNSEIVPRDPAASWIGTVDEVRAWNTSLTDAQHRAYHDDPVKPLATGNAALRLMFNDGQPFVAYYATSDAAVVGESELVAGVAGPDLVAGEDYRIENNTIETVDGGYVDGAPVLIVGAGGVLASTAEGLIGGIGSAIDLIPILLLVMMMSVIIATIPRLRDQRL